MRISRCKAILGLIVATFCMATQALAQGNPTSPNPTQPNIVYILADDLGWKDVGFHGSDIKTPNIDRLASTGARSSNFMLSRMCTPTRAALMTGRYPLRYGLADAGYFGRSRPTASNRRAAASTGLEGSRLQDGACGQMAPRSRPSANTGRVSVALTIIKRSVDRRDRLFHS